MKPLSFYPLSGLPEVEPGRDLAGLLLPALKAVGTEPGDILVVTHKILSKVLGLVADPSGLEPGEGALRAAELCHKDPQVVQLILNCSAKLYACARDILIGVRRDGWICCNSGVDHSNSGGAGKYILLPEDCDAHAKALSETLSAALGFPLPVLICDTHGRVLRNGTTGVVVGSWGLEPIRRYTGCADRDGNLLLSTQEAVADEIAGAATLVMGQGAEGIPAVLVRGFAHSFHPVDSESLKRAEEGQLFRATGEPIYPEEDVRS